MNLTSELIWHLVKMTIGLLLLYFILGFDSNAFIWIGIIILTYIFLETSSYIAQLKNNKDLALKDSLDLSLTTYGKSILFGIIISCLLSISGSAIFGVEKIGHFFEANEYEVKYYVKYSFNENKEKYNLGIAQISKESYGEVEKYYFISKITANNIEINFDEPCNIEKIKKWFKCDSNPNTNQEIWLYITEEKVE